MLRIGKPELVIASVADPQRDHTAETSWPGLSRPCTSS
jgi:hypothetical protein